MKKIEIEAAVNGYIVTLNPYADDPTVYIYPTKSDLLESMSGLMQEAEKVEEKKDEPSSSAEN